METPTHVPTWVEDNYESFSPPICNKLLHRDQLSIMFVGGPNSRSDFHIDESSEFFYQIHGNMQLPIVLPGNRLRVVNIREGDVFLLPSRVPHSPQRPERNSVGMVIERQRNLDSEWDCMRWYNEGSLPESQEDLDVFFEKYFKCEDLGKDLVPVAREYQEFVQSNDTFQQSQRALIKPINDHEQSLGDLPEPFNLKEWINARRDILKTGENLSLFGSDHPDNEFRVEVSSLGTEKVSARDYETFVYQIEGKCRLVSKNNATVHMIGEESCMVLPKGSEWIIERDGTSSLTMIIHCDPHGNK